MSMAKKWKRRFLEPCPAEGQDEETAIEESLKRNDEAFRRLARL